MTSQTLPDSNGKHTNAELVAQSSNDVGLVAVVVLISIVAMTMGCGFLVVDYGPWLNGNPLQLSIS